jgi:UDP-N-acetylglucosamine diphosphorylase/glucosamine-1-phosphate N-acetyltransferase
MDNLVLDESSSLEDLFPFTLTRGVLDIRVGILTLREKWQRLLPSVSISSGGISPAYPGSPAIRLPANILPTRQLANSLRTAYQGRADAESPGHILQQARRIHYPWELFQQNGEALTEDFALLTSGKTSRPIPASVQAISPSAIFIEEGAKLGHCLLNAETGPIYIGHNAEIMEGATIRGPFALCEGAVVKMGARIYGATTIGPYSVAGGEIKNSILFGYSNKAHEGYLGDSVIGEWCNLGAGTSNSNIKNTAGPVKVWNPSGEGNISAGLKCGLLMGDYSRSAINSSFNTGTLVGVCCHIFGEGLTPTYIPSFSWGQSGSRRYEWEKALLDIANWKKLKNQFLTDLEIRTLKAIFDKL